MKMKRSKKTLSLILCTVLIVAMALTFSACGNDGNVNDDAKTEKSFVFKVVDLDGSEKSFDIKTEAKTVGEALLAEKLISGEVGQYGLMVDTVNGIKYDYNEDSAYWAFYVNGEYATAGVDTTTIEEGATYSFKVEK